MVSQPGQVVKLVGHPRPDASAINSSKTIKSDLFGNQLTMLTEFQQGITILFVQKDTFVHLSSSVCLTSQLGSHICGLHSDINSTDALSTSKVIPCSVHLYR